MRAREEAETARIRAEEHTKAELARVQAEQSITVQRHAAADVVADQRRMETAHREEGRADRITAPGVQVRHGGDLLHAGGARVYAGAMRGASPGPKKCDEAIRQASNSAICPASPGRPDSSPNLTPTPSRRTGLRRRA